ncbi:hypothetical protein B0T14DRAFT_500265 [Immersiella caudata]|uniref:Protein SQS1 n=1 Tax=Immersiella caudata TaxID=314043 RepID=A0AA39TSC4_9PEZI|nr:hypothetical protein B0T14DRAFT_500265 [Immersiella caudata]
MRDEARNTASHEPLWAQTTKLRLKPVLFVSAGFVDPLKDIKPLDLESESKSPDGIVSNAQDSEEDVRGPKVIEAAQAQVTVAVHSSTTLQVGTLAHDKLKAEFFMPAELAEEPANPSAKQDETANSSTLFFIDLQGDKTKRPSELAKPEIPEHQPRPGDSDSSEDVILFRGRTVKSQTSLPSSKRHRDHGRKHEVSVPASPERTAPPTQLRCVPKQHSKPRQTQTKSSAPHPQVTEESGDVDDEDAILADYIANMANDSDDDLLTSQLRALGERELGGDHGALEISSGSEASEAEGVGDGQEAEDVELGEDGDIKMDDETLARLLARQELLDIDSDEFPDSSGSCNGHGQSSKAYRPRNRHANTDSVLDAFGDLDLASWAPPPEMLGQRKGKRRKQAPAFNVSDSELESALWKAWERDRERKKNRKMEREALRATGLLSKKANPDDLRVKYQEGMKLDDMKYELLIFLTGTAETIQFPPMDKQARKTLHELAGKFKIKSQSTGSGDQRRPVLYRTKRTARYSEDRFDDAEAHVNEAAARIGRKYFPRLDTKGKGQTRGGGGGAGRGGFGAVRYRDGEIAGASVPELGQENKGRAMLEKMGWAKGMGLGSLDNKGILEPVVQVVKTSKAGLG